jgi:hypothetical protein
MIESRHVGLQRLTDEPASPWSHQIHNQAFLKLDVYSTITVSTAFMKSTGVDPVTPVDIAGNKKVAVDFCAIARLDRPANTNVPAENAVTPTIVLWS